MKILAVGDIHMAGSYLPRLSSAEKADLLILNGDLTNFGSAADAEMVLAKADLGIAEHYSELSGDLHSQFFPLIEKEHELTQSLILEYSEHESLLEGDSTLQRAIMLRNPYVDPMSLMQIDLLARWRATDRSDDALFAALLASINGIAQGLQNTG